MSFWNALAIYCENLAPVATPALTILGRVSDAVDTAEQQVLGLQERNRQLRAEIAELDAIPLLTEEDFDD